jgi:aspartate/methionine/tyrosine aminotransferase
MGFLSDRSRYALNPIEVEDVVAEELAKKGRGILSLNRGDPAKYFPTPKYIIEAYVEALREGKTSYSKAQGINELSDAIAKRYRLMHGLHLKREDIVSTTGVSEGLLVLNSALVNPGDSAVLFKPYYPPYMAELRINGGNVVMESYNENDSWNVHIENLRHSLSILKKTDKLKHVKYMLVTNPNNPTGTVLRRKVLEEIVDIANQYGLFLISDEIYDEIIYNGARFTSLSELAKGVPHAVINGLSKDYDCTGFRIGYVIIPEDDRRSLALKNKIVQYEQVRISLNTPSEWAAVEAINNTAEHRKAVHHLVKEIESRVNFAVSLLEENPYMETVRPNGAYYIFPKIDLKSLRFKSDFQFVDTLLKKEGVQIVWGSGFGEPSHVRIVALAPKDILEHAINKINSFCRKNARSV